ncbi:MAG TPA: PGF-CTERM sorting domain-containing protein, partial [Methanocellaceae archaeon]
IGEEANNQMAQARQKIAGIGELKSPGAKDMLNQSNTAYSLSQNAYTSGDYQGAIANASQSFKLANDSATAEQKWRAEHPASPGFEAVYAMAALLSVFGIASMRARKERKD